MKHDRIKPRQACNQVKMSVGRNDVRQAMILHNSRMDGVARPHSPRSVLLEDRDRGLHVGRGDRKDLVHDRHEVSSHVEGIRVSSQRAVAVQNLLNDLCIDHHLQAAAGDLCHHPLTGVTIFMGRAGCIHRNRRIQERGSRRHAHLLDRTPSDFLFHLLPVRNGKFQRQKAL